MLMPFLHIVYCKRLGIANLIFLEWRLAHLGERIPHMSYDIQLVEATQCEAAGDVTIGAEVGEAGTVDD